MSSGVTIEYTVNICQEGNQFIAPAMPLDVMSSGSSPKAARQALDVTVKVFLLSREDIGATTQILQECGYDLRQGS